MTKKNYRTFNYLNISSASRPSTSTDADFTVDLQFNEFYHITQEDLNDVIRHLDLQKKKSELLFQDGNNATFWKKMSEFQCIVKGTKF